MRTIKYALLGMLCQKNMTGYELMKLFEGPLSEFWSVRHSQIYPELKRLTEEGLITYHVEISGSVLEKKMYTVTDKGKKDFFKWLQTSYPMRPTPKDEFRLQLFYSHLLTPEERLKLLESKLIQHQHRLNHLQENKRGFASIPPKEASAFSDYLVLLGAITREEATCSWIKQCIELYKNFDQ
ncbi:PadR family transcriptional regulator [Merdibacter massiliensis]|uniref:PadR family transcriptional regulator n=1 Tax=Merdibacter massiliensis TaxID=1871030 RepID=UPI00096AA1E6|nr:PadR family transcriptional regulator [Merdibacter massiliensis]